LFKQQNNNKESVIFSVLDAGARFGIHESWLGFEGPVTYYLFEPDSEEVLRLKEKYKDTATVEVMGMALGETEGELVLNQLKHRGGTSFLKPDYNSRYWKDVRPSSGVIERTITVPLTTIDSWCIDKKINLDFCKIDVEGAEAAVIRGAENQLRNNVLGVRAEVLFNTLYENQIETFSEVNKSLSSYGFTFLNFEKNFSNSQIPFSDLHVGEKFGQLIGTDAIWVKPIDSLVPASGNTPINPYRVLKMAYFAMRNGASDLAMSLLQRSAEKDTPMISSCFDKDPSGGEKELISALYQLEREVAQLLFNLRDVPRYEASYLSGIFEKIFQKEWVGPGEYYIRYPLRS